MRVFVTGASGFLGYHIVKACLGKGHHVACLRRETSKSMFDTQTDAQVVWLNESASEFHEKLQTFNPQILIHSAWGGVSATGRNNEEIQNANVIMTNRILNWANFQQVIMLGSQDEYGQIDCCVDEHQPLCPLSAYARAKVACCEALQHYAERTKAEWQWIRIFSIYGNKQQDCWLIPSLILKCLNGEKRIETTPGEQQYSYLFATDFGEAIASIVGQKGKSGIYNLSSSHPIALKDLFLTIKQLTGSDVEFTGTMPYRPNQSMVILGNSTKFMDAFGPFEHTTLQEGLLSMIQNKKQQITIK